MRWLIIFIIIFSSFLWCGDNNCFTILAGRQATADGSVLFAHNEDDSGKRFFVNIIKTPENPNGFSPNPRQKKLFPIYPPANRTVGFLWLQVPGTEFADSYFNENGVAIASNACESREDKGELSENGIGFLLRRLMAERAHSAREAIQIAAEYLGKYGYSDSGRTYCIADSNEAWVLHVVRGKHWLAQRVPDDHVAIIPNYYTSREVNLENKDSVSASNDLVDYAIKRGWMQPVAKNTIDFAKTYGSEKSLSAKANILRHWRGISLLAAKNFSVDGVLPFSFVPGKKLKFEDLFKVLRDHYEGTSYDETKGYKLGSPNETSLRTICTQSTQYSLVVQLRNFLPREYAFVAWVCLHRPDSNAFSPWYISLTAPPSGYTQGASESALETHMQKPSAYFTPDPRLAFWCFSELSRQIDQNYRELCKISRREWQNFEEYAIKSTQKKEREFAYILKIAPQLLLAMVTNFSQQLEYQKWFLAAELIEKFKN